jgi:serine/threonine protein kinase
MGVHSDMKPENILLDAAGHCKLSDLGLAVQSQHKQKGYAGTPGYTAPEVCASRSYTAAVDFFSLGVTLYRFLFGRKPFQGERGSDLDTNVQKIEPPYYPSEVSAAAIDLLKGFLIKDPSQRLGARAGGFAEIKEHRTCVERNGRESRRWRSRRSRRSSHKP